MIKIHCRTNLDILGCEEWPGELPDVPRIGDHIISAHAWGVCHLMLVVVGVTWEKKKTWTTEEAWYPTIELHLPKSFKDITGFYEWYGKITGKGKSYFI